MQSTAAIEIAKHSLLSGGLILAIGTLTGLLVQKIKIPDVAALLKVAWAYQKKKYVERAGRSEARVKSV